VANEVAIGSLGPVGPSTERGLGLSPDLR